MDTVFSKEILIVEDSRLNVQITPQTGTLAMLINLPVTFTDISKRRCSR
ncbi:hypothetical protein PQ690_06325 [Thermoanaerobacterium thermosaccharolyticum]